MVPGPLTMEYTGEIPEALSTIAENVALCPPYKVAAAGAIVTTLCSSPYTTSSLEKVGTYTFPFATVGKLNLAKAPRESLLLFCPLFHNSRERSLASKARSRPGNVTISELPCAVVAQTIPVPLVAPLD